MRLALPPFALLVVATHLTAQTTKVLPSSAATTPPGGINATVFHGTATVKESRTQVLYDAADVASTGLLKSLAVRRPAGFGGANVASTFHLRIDVSMSQVGYLAASPTYAANHGPAVATVFNGPIGMPASSNGTWPRPWEAPFVFTTPFVFIFTSAVSLCVELQSTGGGRASRPTRGSFAPPPATQRGPGAASFGCGRPR